MTSAFPPYMYTIFYSTFTTLFPILKNSTISGALQDKDLAYIVHEWGPHDRTVSDRPQLISNRKITNTKFITSRVWPSAQYQTGPQLLN